MVESRFDMKIIIIKWYKSGNNVNFLHARPIILSFVLLVGVGRLAHLPNPKR